MGNIFKIDKVKIVCKFVENWDLSGYGIRAFAQRKTVKLIMPGSLSLYPVPKSAHALTCNPPYREK